MNGVAEALWVRIQDAVEREQTYIHIRIDEITMGIDELERLQKRNDDADLIADELVAEIGRLNLKIELMEANP